MASLQTSLISIISTEHGRMRREQRDITKRDLQKAIKYGSRQRTWNNRWKVEYDGIIFIATNDLRREVTAFPSPLSLASVDKKTKEDHRKAKLIIDKKPELCVSHTVLVVDNSGSMLTHDIELHRDRQVAAYSTTALEFVAEQLLTGSSNNSDSVSLVEFQRTATTVFSGEPMSWVLFNKLLSRRDWRGYLTRTESRARDMVNADSNYLPALQLAKQNLQTGDHEHCALSMLFLSDGAPSDARDLGLTPAAAERRILEVMRQIATEFGDRLDVKLIGFGNVYEDFSVLKAMARAVTDCDSGARADFVYCDKVAHSMGTAVSSLVSSLQLSKTSLAMKFGSGRAEREDIEFERIGHLASEWKYYEILEHLVYDPKQNDWWDFEGLPPGAISKSNAQEAREREGAAPSFLAMSTQACGKGVERVAFRCRLSDEEIPQGHVFDNMVAKETLLVDRIEENVEFHLSFCKTQQLASYLASEFNSRLRALKDFAAHTTPRVEFLECSILLLDDPASPDGTRGVLVEKMLDTENLAWCKWNDNDGRIKDVAVHLPIDVDYELEKLQQEKNAALGLIVEGDSDEEEESDLDSDGEDSFEQLDQHIGDAYWNDSPEIDPAVYLQAFTHFTYRFTNKKVMVCDLQGVYDTDTAPPTFYLTDPAIHYRSNRGRRAVFGKTDKGEQGVDRFFKTHKCSEVCKALQLTRNNLNWRRDWHHRSDELNQQMRNLASHNVGR